MWCVIPFIRAASQVLIDKHELSLCSHGEWCMARGAEWWGLHEEWASLPAMLVRQLWLEQRPLLALAHAYCRKGRSSSSQRYTYLLN